MILLVGLGNFDQKYSHTRHNVGFWLLDSLATKLQLSWKNTKHFLVAESNANNQKVVLVKPNTFMNASGLAVKEAMQKYNASLSELILFYDDFNVPVGSYRLRAGGSSGGHNGVKSVIDTIGSGGFWRYRIGIGSQDEHKANEPLDPADYSDFVLSKFSAKEEKKVRQVVDFLSDNVLAFISQSKSLEEETIHVI